LPAHKILAEQKLNRAELLAAKVPPVFEITKESRQIGWRIPRRSNPF
jgi:hypothetical protein